MKKLLISVLVGALVLSSICIASAAEFKVRGTMDFNFEWNDDMTFVKEAQGNQPDSFYAKQRMRTQIDIIASENLKGVVFFEIGNIGWGDTESGGQLDTDGINIETKRAYIEWMVPNTALSIRMGLQGIALPGFVAGSPVMDADVAGIVASYAFNDMIAATVFWARPYDNFDDSGSGRSMDETDVFGLLVPITADGFNITPWGAYALIGKDSEYTSRKEATRFGGDLDNTVTAWWAGVSFEINLWDPLIWKTDAMYGSQDSGDDAYDTKGWFVATALDYKMDWGIPGIFAWYATGDGDEADDMGTMPMLSNDTGFGPTSFGFDGGYSALGSDHIVSANGLGTWGVGLQIADLSFLEDLRHTVRVAYYRGTHDKDAPYNNYANRGANTRNALFLTEKDSAIEVNLDSEYKIYENLSMYVELSYIHLSTGDAWDDRYGSDNIDDAWRAGLSFQYRF